MSWRGRRADAGPPGVGPEGHQVRRGRRLQLSRAQEQWGGGRKGVGGRAPGLPEKEKLKGLTQTVICM